MQLLRSVFHTVSNQGGILTAMEQLNQLYEIKEKLSPLTAVLIVGFVETQKKDLKAHDIKFIRDIYPEYFRKDGKLKGSFR